MSPYSFPIIPQWHPVVEGDGIKHILNTYKIDIYENIKIHHHKVSIPIPRTVSYKLYGGPSKKNSEDLLVTVEKLE